MVGSGSELLIRIRQSSPYPNPQHWKKHNIGIFLSYSAGRLDANQPIDLAALCGTKIFPLCPDRNHFGFHLTSDGVDIFRARINIEVQWADEQTIVAVERAGGRLTTAYFDLHSVIALNDPMGFFKSGAPIPRRLTPPGNLLEYYIHPANRGYLADPARVAEERLILGQKYGYEPPDYALAEDWMSETKESIRMTHNYLHLSSVELCCRV